MTRSDLAVTVLAIVIGTAGVTHHVTHSTIKHQGPCQVMANNYGRLWLKRPNGQVFSMYLDNPPEFRIGLKFKDLEYTDDSVDMKHFISATLDEGK